MKAEPVSTDPLSASGSLIAIENPFSAADEAPAQPKTEAARPKTEDGTPAAPAALADAFEETQPIVQYVSRFRRTCPTPYKYYRWARFYCGRLGFALGCLFVAWLILDLALPFSFGDWICDPMVTSKYLLSEESKPGAWCVNVTLDKSIDKRELSIEFDYDAQSANGSSSSFVMCTGACVDGRPTAYECTTGSAVIVLPRWVRIPYYSAGGIMLSFDDSAPAGLPVRGAISDVHCRFSTPLAYSLLGLAYFPLVVVVLALVVVILAVAAVYFCRLAWWCARHSVVGKYNEIVGVVRDGV